MRREGYEFQVSTPKVLYKEINLEAVMKLWWQSASQSKEYVCPINGFEAKYACQQPVVCYTTKGNTLYAIALKYPDEVLQLTNIETPSADMKVQLLGCNKELKWDYNSATKTLSIYTTNLKYSDIKSNAAWVFVMQR